MQRFILPRLHDFLFIVIFVGALLSGARMLNADSDLGRHITVGTYILQHGQVPTHDILSFTKAGDSRPPYEWLAQVLFAAAYGLIGLDGVVLLTSLVIGAAFTAVYLDSLQRSGAPILSLLLAAWAAIASSLHWLSRPHIFSFLFFALWVAMLDRLRRGERQPLWAFPLLMLVWANTHGGFIFGVLAYAAYFAGWLVEWWRKSSDWSIGRKWAIVGVTSLLASVITPDLWRNWDATLNNRSAFILSQTVETMPLNVALPNIWPFLALLVLAVLLILVRRGRVPAARAFLLAGLAVMAFAMTRNVPFFVIAAAPICAEWLAGALQRLTYWFRFEEGLHAIDTTLRGFVWSALPVILAAGFFASSYSRTHESIYPLNPKVFPLGAMNWLQEHPEPGNMFNDFNWGGYLLFKLWPEQRVFIDSQSDFYGETFIRQYVAILTGSGDWEAQLDRYNVHWMVIPQSAPLTSLARQSPAWQLEYEDSTAAVFVHR